LGRTSTSQGDDGRDNNPQDYTKWMACGGVKGGLAHGKTDECGYFAVEDKADVLDLHTTVLHLLDPDHTRPIYRHAGRQSLLTDVYGEVIREFFARLNPAGIAGGVLSSRWPWHPRRPPRMIQPGSRTRPDRRRGPGPARRGGGIRWRPG
jgi:hypothetical protein